MKQYAGILATLFVGCATGAAVQGLAAQSFAPNPNAPKWEQFCDFTTDGGIPKRWQTAVNESLAVHGQQGWELVTFSGLHNQNPCFRRLAP